MLAYHRRQLAYDHWANETVIASLASLGPPPPRALRFMAHILGAECLWLARLRKEGSPLAVWPELSVSECAARSAELRERWSAYVDGLSPASLAAPVTYTNTKGEAWTNSVGDILTHVVVHSAYHRGQIATDVRAAGHTPAYTDFIHAVRQGYVD